MRKFIVLFCILFSAGGARLAQSSSVPMGNQGADKAFADLAEEYIGGYLAWRPQIGTALGYHQYDGKMSDLSQASLAAEQERLESFAKRLAQLDDKLLSDQARFDCQILRGAVEREIFSFAGLKIYTQNPMTYAGALDVNIYIKRDFAPLADRVKSIIALLNQASNVTAAARANLANSLPRPFIETAIEVAGGSADFLGKDLVEALKEVKDEALMAEFGAANQRAIEEMKRFVVYLKETKLPNANEQYALGRKKYIQLLRAGEMVELSPEELLKVGESELRRKQQDFAEAARLIDAQKPAVEVYQAIQKDHPTEASLIPDTVRDLDMIRRFVIEHHIITIPSPIPARVAETPRYMRATSFASMDTPGPFETKATEAYYYVTPPEPEWAAKQKEEWLSAFNYYTTDIVSIHEAYPGHYVQFLCLNASSADKLEKIFNSYAFVEGWAHYGEQMMVDEGFGGGERANPTAEEKIRAAKYRLAQTDEALLRVCRFCVSIRMHCQGMTVEEAAKFFRENCYYEEKPARQEALRGSFDPEYLYYTLGKLEIFKLREDYRRQEGANFSLQKFHDELLRHGAPPLPLLREVMLKDPGIWKDTF
jgi:uncharacterized protein (DUF885 family)